MLDYKLIVTVRQNLMTFILRRNAQCQDSRSALNEYETNIVPTSFATTGVPSPSLPVLFFNTHNLLPAESQNKGHLIIFMNFGATKVSALGVTNAYAIFDLHSKAYICKKYQSNCQRQPQFTTH